MAKIVKCAVCGRIFEHDTNLPYRYCSKECQTKGRRDYQREYRAEYRRQNLERWECEKARERERQGIVRHAKAMELRRASAGEILELAKKSNAAELIAQYLADNFKYKSLS